ncbi:hypothetical protein J7K25_05630 [bacterium]|nr:hypothetical protein [bacterium]
MKKFLKWVIFVLVISGWIAFGIGYMISQNKIKKLQDEITRLNSELTSYKIISEDVEKSSIQIDKIIQQLNELKTSLEKLQGKK